MTLHDFFIETRRLVAEGWVQGTMHTMTSWGDGTVTHRCLLGAMLRAADFVSVDVMQERWPGITQQAYPVLAAVLGVDADRFNPVAYNDTPGRTQAEVLALLDQAISRCPA